MKKRVLAFLLSLSLVAALQPSLVAFAAEPAECTTGVEIEENEVEAPANPENYGITDNGDSVSIVDGKITVEEGSGVTSESSDIAITNSNITAKNGDGVYADYSEITISKSNITFDGQYNDGLCLFNGTNATVSDSSISATKGDDGYSLWPIDLIDNSTVIINNCKLVTDADHSYSVSVQDGSIAIINKGEIKNTAKKDDGEGGAAVYVYGEGNDGSVLIANDSTITGETGILVEGDSSNRVILNNTIVTATGTEDNDAALWIQFTGDTSSVPTICVDKLEATNGADLIVALDMDGNDITDQVANQVYYIINTEKLDNGTITVSKAANVTEVKDADGNVLKDKNGNTLYAANRSNTVIINIAAASGYEVKSVDGGKATLTKNADGSYTLTIPEGGGVDISAVISAIVNPSPAVSGGMTTEDICAGIANGYQAMLNAAKLPAANTASAVNATNNVSAAESVKSDNWTAVNNTLTTGTAGISSVVGNLMKVDIANNTDRTVPADVVANLKSSTGVKQLHVFIGNDDAVTFDDSQDLSNYQATNFEHVDTVNENSKTIDFVNKQGIGAKVTFHTVVSKPASAVKVYKMVNGTKKFVTKVVSDSNGCVCFPISETAEYVLEY